MHLGLSQIFYNIANDKTIDIEDLEKVKEENENDLKLLTAFCNAKFSIERTECEIKQETSLEKLKDGINMHIRDVLGRATNLKRNEEFIKKKWKEFFKICFLRVKHLKPMKNKGRVIILFK